MELASRAGASVIALDDAEYPVQLHALGDPPPVLFALGALDLLGAACVAIVGTRRATSYGERVTAELAGALARAGVTIVSGMARGIDGVAHRAALAAGGGTAAVLGTGVDVPYPASHRALHSEIAARGVVLSEEMPGDRASGGSFPKRNRIIAALATATIVVEAPHRSGALITASWATDLNRNVGAVPGPIDVPQSAGTNALLRDGAIMITDVADALMLVGVAPPRSASRAPADATQLAIWKALEHPAPDLDTLATRAALPARHCLAAVTALELDGAIECALTGEIRRRGLSSRPSNC
ncbi:MAG: DNA-processing protein DprA [Gemmatimonadota bacterium]|nr:DNA-processing protein DprA [Gemmatimonadota bacterium]